MERRQPILHTLLKAASAKKADKLRSEVQATPEQLIRRRRKKHTRRQAVLLDTALAIQIAMEWISLRNLLRLVGVSPHTANVFDDPEDALRGPHPQALLRGSGNDLDARRTLLDKCLVRCGCGKIGCTELSVRDLSTHVHGLGCSKCGALLPLMVDAVVR